MRCSLQASPETPAHSGSSWGVWLIGHRIILTRSVSEESGGDRLLSTRSRAVRAPPKAARWLDGLTRSVSEGCRKSLAARRQRPRSRFGLVCGTTFLADLDRRVPGFLVVFSEKSPKLALNSCSVPHPSEERGFRLEMVQ